MKMRPIISTENSHSDWTCLFHAAESCTAVNAAESTRSVQPPVSPAPEVEQTQKFTKKVVPLLPPELPELKVLLLFRH